MGNPLSRVQNFTGHRRAGHAVNWLEVMLREDNIS